MNYRKAIKLLYRVENPEVVQIFGGNTDKLERELERMARGKFKFVVSMQRYSNCLTRKSKRTPSFYCVRIRICRLPIDGHSEINPETGKRRPKLTMHAIIFYRGEYLQLIDANQDNYLEECLKIRNVLGEFEEYNMSDQTLVRYMGPQGIQESSSCHRWCSRVHLC